MCWVFCFFGVFLIERASSAGKLQSTVAAERPELEVGSLISAWPASSQHGRVWAHASHAYLFAVYLACVTVLAAVRVLVTTLWPLILRDLFGEFADRRHPAQPHHYP